MKEKVKAAIPVLTRHGYGALNQAGTFFGWFAISLLLSRGSLLGQMSPFGVAVAAAAPKRHLLPALMGVCLGYILPGIVGSPLKYLGAATVAVILKWALDGAGNLSKKVFFAPAVAGLSLLAVSMITAFGDDRLLAYRVLSLASEVILCGGAAYFMVRAQAGAFKSQVRTQMDSQELVSILIMLAIVISGLGTVDLAYFNLAAIAATVLILIASMVSGETGGSIVGSTMGIMAVMTYQVQPVTAAGYAFGGLLAGLYSHLGKSAAALAFVVVSGLSAAASGGDTPLIKALFESSAAALLFLTIPFPVFVRLRSFFKTPVAQESDTVKERIKNRLGRMSRTIGDIRETLEQYSARVGKSRPVDYNYICNSTSALVCEKCKNRMRCWENGYSDTMAAFNDMVTYLRKYGSLTASAIPEQFTAGCVRVPEVLRHVNNCYKQIKERENEMLRNTELRNVTLDQFSSMSRLLFELAEDFESSAYSDVAVRQTIERGLEAKGIHHAVVSCSVGATGRLSVTVEVLKDEENDFVEDVIQVVNKNCGVSMASPVVAENDQLLSLSFQESPAFGLSTGTGQRKRPGEKVSGDVCEFKSSENGQSVVVLSDGMGSGTRAAVDAVMASKLMLQLMSSGFSPQSALKIVNSSLTIKPGEESIATLDIGVFDLYTGELHLYKAGAAASFIRKGGRVLKIENSSLPAGILREVSFAQSSIKLEEGDVVVLLSDGALSAGDDVIENLLLDYTGSNPAFLAEKILSQAEKSETAVDDITVFVAELKRL